MDINTYVSGIRKKAKEPGADILERWNTRVVAQGLDKRGKQGAEDYLSRYGKGISSKKVSLLALMAESAGEMDVAAGFWEQAYFIETGKSEIYGGGGAVKAIKVPTQPLMAKPARLTGLPSELQPGCLVTMQPVDADLPQASYIANPAYIGQPKRDGNRNIVFATPTAVSHQSRSTSVVPTFSAAFDIAAMEAAAEIGEFVLDGEKYYKSAKGKEHRTAAQAATENMNMGKGEHNPLVCYSAFKALYFKGASLLNESEENRILAGEEIVAVILKHLPAGVEVEATPTAFTTAAKAAMAKAQKEGGFEGEVWTLRDARYTAGKTHKVAAVRTKYLQEMEVFVTKVITSSCKGRSVSAFEVSDVHGKPLGKVGTGFDEATAAMVARRHAANPGSVKIEVRCQNLTETGVLWHPRMIGVV